MTSSSNDSDSASSPALFFYTPPTSPPADSPDLYFTPPSSPYPVPPSDSDSDYDGAFPIPTDAAIDLALDEEGLTTLEKVYLYSRSKAYHHRIFIVHELHHYLDHVSPQEAVEYVLPLLSGLAMDEGACVRL
jgi:serine/threonine-protein phosphatase 4 regulatory subunit 1